MEDAIVRLKESILDHISLNKEAFFKSQQKNEPDLTVSEKRRIAEELLDKNASTFLLRYGKYLEENHLEYFANNDDYEVHYHVEERRKELAKPKEKVIVRNRRLEALRRLAEGGEYFSDKEMKMRNPLLFEELVGQFLTKDEKSQFETARADESTSFATYFMEIVEKDLANSKMLQQIENDASLMPEHDSARTSKIALWGEIAGGPRAKQRVLNNSRPEEVSSDEKSLLLNEFRSKVFSDFLGGKDEEFDYSNVDSNKDYDDLCTIEQDQQEDYFDSESPKTLMSDDD